MKDGPKSERVWQVTVVGPIQKWFFSFSDFRCSITLEVGRLGRTLCEGGFSKKMTRRGLSWTHWREQDLLQQLQLHGLEGTNQGKLTKEVLTTAIKKYNTSVGKLKVTGKKEELRERLERCIWFLCLFCACCLPFCAKCHVKSLEGGCPPERETLKWVCQSNLKGPEKGCRRGRGVISPPD